MDQQEVEHCEVKSSVYSQYATNKVMAQHLPTDTRLTVQPILLTMSLKFYDSEAYVQGPATLD